MGTSVSTGLRPWLAFFRLSEAGRIGMSAVVLHTWIVQTPTSLRGLQSTQSRPAEQTDFFSRLSPLASGLSLLSLASHLSLLTSCLWPLTSFSRLPPLASHLLPLASHFFLSPPTSRLSLLASGLSLLSLASHLSLLTSCLWPLTSFSRLPPLASHLLPLASHFPLLPTVTLACLRQPRDQSNGPVFPRPPSEHGSRKESPARRGIGRETDC